MDAGCDRFAIYLPLKKNSMILSVHSRNALALVLQGVVEPRLLSRYFLITVSFQARREIEQQFVTVLPHPSADRD